MDENDLLYRDDVMSALNEVQGGLTPTKEMQAIYARIRELPARPVVPLTTDQIADMVDPFSRPVESLTEPPETPDYRFGRLIKHGDYAYARGLTIAPSHLPKALDAMEKDGWSLLAIFGETDSASVGFIFRKTVGRNKPAPEPRLTKNEIFDALKAGEKSFDAGENSPYQGGSLEHSLHAYGWVKRDLQIQLCKARPSYGKEQVGFGNVKPEQL